MLSRKQRDVLTFSPDITTEEIATSLGMSLGSTKRLITETIEAMGANTRGGATILALKDGLLSVDEIIVRDEEPTTT